MRRTASMTACALCVVFGAGAHAETDWRRQPEADRLGRLYYYERTNTDGSMDERVTVFRRDADTIEVYKENGLCTDAALVTAVMDWETFSATGLTGGGLTPDGSQDAGGSLAWTPGADHATAAFGDDEMTVSIETVPWHDYDFDLASLTVATPHLARPHDGFVFGMTLFWNGPADGPPLSWMGDVRAEFVGAGVHRAAPTRRYELSGTAFEGERAIGGDGMLWLDAEDGHIVDAHFPAPNHDGYTDFRLRLLRVSDGGEAEWRALLLAHYAEC